jgi:opacity protein-like surface antigen
MKTLLIGIALFLAWAAPAVAADIQGKWGLGVGAGGVIGTTPDLTLIRGRSHSSAWLLDLRFSGSNNDGTLTVSDTITTVPTNENSNSLFISGGPGLRRFLLPESDFSPYFDLSSFVEYAHAHQFNGQPGAFVREDNSRWALGLGVAFGAEYFTRWHFSVAAHTGLATVRWASFDDKFETSPGFHADRHNSGASTAFGVSPVLALRVYF